MWNIKDYKLERNLSQVCKIKTLSEKKTTKKEKEKQFLKSDKLLGLDLDTRTGGRMKALQKVLLLTWHTWIAHDCHYIKSCKLPHIPRTLKSYRINMALKMTFFAYHFKSKSFWPSAGSLSLVIGQGCDFAGWKCHILCYMWFTKSCLKR